MDNQPTKETVRNWLQQRRISGDPPSDIEQIRQQLGWTLAGKLQALINPQSDYQYGRVGAC